jgi:RNA polymerase sigma factor (sigma-70 family)
VAQEALARAFARWAKVEQWAPAWVSKVAANLALDVVRRRARHRSDRPVPDEVDPAPGVVERQALVAALRALPRRQREAVVLRYLADLPEAEVAQLLGCTTGSVKRHTHRGVAGLRATLGLTLPPSMEAAR